MTVVILPVPIETKVPVQVLMSLLDPEHDPPFFSIMLLDLDLSCFPELAPQNPKFDQLPQTQFTRNVCTL